MRHATKVVAIVMALAGLTFAQAANSADQATIQLLVQQVRELQEKVKVLEAKSATGSPAPTEAVAPAQPVQEVATIP